MKIIGFETFLVPPRWLFLRVDTDEGVSGWGEPVVEGRAHTVAALVAELFDYLIGTDPLRVEEHWQVLTKGGFYRGGPVLSSAVAGIDQALWDIKGRAAGLPVHELLGGPVRDRVRVYTWARGASVEELCEDAQSKVAAGFDAVKCTIGDQFRHLESAAAIRAVVARIERLREAVGDAVDIMIDLHGRLSIPMARRILPLLEPAMPFFVEEPVLPEFSRDLRAVTAGTTIPVATGERLYSRWDFRDVLPTGIAVIQPDVSHAGGISEVRRIAAMAETYDVSLAPHCPLGPIALAASIQIGFASPNFLIQEQSLGIGYHADQSLYDQFVDPAAFRFHAGYLDRPTGPGLGIEVDVDAVRHAAQTGHRWRPPIWRHPDGGLAEW